MKSKSQDNGRDAPVRPTCYLCFKPRHMCLCNRGRQVNNRTGIIILQHPHEARHPFGTARIAALYLGNVRIEVANRDFDGTVAHEMTLPPDTALLYPGPEVMELSDLPLPALPRHLLLLDGTWNHASQLLRSNPWLSSLRRVSVTPSKSGRYRIRKEPKPNFASTIESIYDLSHRIRTRSAPPLLLLYLLLSKGGRCS